MFSAEKRSVVGEENNLLAQAIQGIATPGATACLFCGKEVGVCLHCFSQDVLEYLEEKNLQLANLFKSQFNLDLKQRMILVKEKKALIYISLVLSFI